MPSRSGHVPSSVGKEARGHAARVARLKEIAPRQIVLESTGSLHHLLVAALAAARLPGADHQEAIKDNILQLQIYMKNIDYLRGTDLNGAPCRNFRLGAAFILAALLAVFGTGCPRRGTPPTIPVRIVDRYVIDFGSWQPEILPRSDLSVDQTFTFYAGIHTTSFDFALTTEGLQADQAAVRVLSGSGVELQVIDTNGPITSVRIPGNVARLRIVQEAKRTNRLRVTVHSLNAEGRKPAPFPAATAQLADWVPSFPLTNGEMVEISLSDNRFLPAATPVYYFTVNGVSSKTFDFAADGQSGATMWLRQTSNSFPSGTLTDEIWPPTGSSVSLRRFVNYGRDGLTAAVTASGAIRPTHVRIGFRELASPQLLSFPSPDRSAFVPVPVGVDWDPNDGTMGPQSGNCDCLNHNGVRGIAVDPFGNPFMVPDPSQQVPLRGPDGNPVTDPFGNTIMVAAMIELPFLPPPCYDGHQGTDYPLALHILGQEIGVDVTAAASGTVVLTADGNVDNCFADPLNNFAITCPGTTDIIANVVGIRQDDGRVAYYYHLRRGSLAVSVGQRVHCGTRLGQVASSGESTQPHLHFEIRDLNQASLAPGGNSLPSWGLVNDVRNRSTTIDPYKPNIWRTLDMLIHEPLSDCR